MKSVDFRGEMTPNGQISVPPEVASQVPAGKTIEVVLVWDVSDDEAWRAAGRSRFESAYVADDSVYEETPTIHDAAAW